MRDFHGTGVMQLTLTQIDWRSAEQFLASVARLAVVATKRSWRLEQQTCSPEQLKGVQAAIPSRSSTPSLRASTGIQLFEYRRFARWRHATLRRRQLLGGQHADQPALSRAPTAAAFPVSRVRRVPQPAVDRRDGREGYASPSCSGPGQQPVGGDRSVRRSVVPHDTLRQGTRRGAVVRRVV